MSANKRPNILIRIWLGFWRGLTAFRMAVFNVIFLIVVVWLLSVMLSSSDDVVIRDKTTLVVAPQGVIVEEFTGSPAERAFRQAFGKTQEETRLRDVLSALNSAADDERIVQVLIKTDGLLGLAPGMQTELASAFEAFRKSGKTVIAYGGNMLQAQYMLASMADEIWLERSGMLLLEGYGSFRQYFAEGLDKLKVDVNLFRVGHYKSAMEPFIRDDMSEEDREATRTWLGDLWQAWLDKVAMHRGMPVEVLTELTENFSSAVEAAGGDFGAMALEHGLVDKLVTRQQLRTELARRGAPAQKKHFRQIGFESYARLQRHWKPGTDRVGVIVASGAITEGDQPSGYIGSESMERLIQQAVRDERVKAVVLRIDSGGGSAFASELIRNELATLRDAGKPLVVSMGNVAASGGYWIAMGADEVWAYPTTLTGSIGIFGFVPTFQDTLSAIGVHADGVGTTPLSGNLRLDRKLGPEAADLLQSTIEHGYDEFISLVAEHREMSWNEVDQVAQGRVWSGAQARRHGLVDQLGTLGDAIDSAARAAGLGDDYEIGYIERELGAIERFFVDAAAASIKLAGVDMPAGISAWLPGDAGRKLQASLRFVFDAAETGQPAVMAHCLCEAPL